jgi:hypothetical protein
VKCMLCKKLYNETNDSEYNPTPQYGVCEDCLKNLNEYPVELQDEENEIESDLLSIELPYGI